MPRAAHWITLPLRAALAALLIALCGQAAFAQVPEPRRGPSAAAAVREILRHQKGAWTGHLLIQHRERLSESIPAQMKMCEEGENRFVAEHSLQWRAPDGAARELRFRWTFQMLPGGAWTARIGDLAPFEPRLYENAPAPASQLGMMWMGPGSTFDVALASGGGELLMSGFLPVPAEIATGPVWARWQLRRSALAFPQGRLWATAFYALAALAFGFGGAAAGWWLRRGRASRTAQGNNAAQSNSAAE